jgi:putrescine aminotransferase
MRSPERLDDLAHRHLIPSYVPIGEPLEPIIWNAGSGALLWDQEGRQYIDATCGFSQCLVGHGRRELAVAMAAQAEQLEFFMSLGPHTNEPAIRLAAKLAALAPAGLNHVFFTHGGSEAVETALKLIRLYWKTQGCPERQIILAHQEAFHGVTYGALSATGIADLRQGFEPLLPGFVHLPAPGRGLTLEQMLGELERVIGEVGPERIAAYIAEPLLAASGVLFFPDGYWPAAQELLRRHGIPLIFDEMITGFGRLGHWFAAELYGIEPDLMVIGKALSSGYFPIAGLMVHDRLLEGLRDASFAHAFSGSSHPVGCATALANIDIIESEGLLERALEIGALMRAPLEQASASSAVEEVRGQGMLMALDISAEAAQRLDSEDIMWQAHAEGVIVRSLSPRTLVWSPPLVISPEQAQRSVDVVLASLSRG